MVNGKPTVTYRSKEEWVSYSRLFVTESGFKWGSSLVQPNLKGGDQANALGAQRAAEDRLSTVAVIYANLITSDPVMSIIRRGGPVHGLLQAAALPVQQGSDQLLPIIQIAGFASTAHSSAEITKRATSALRQYVEDQQHVNGVPDNQRLSLELVNKAGDSKLFTPRKKTLPIVVFLTVMMATIALTFVLENLNPRVRVVEGGAASADGVVPASLAQ